MLIQGLEGAYFRVSSEGQSILRLIDHIGLFFGCEDALFVSAFPFWILVYC